MNVTGEKKLEILYDHYKDTFSYIREYLKQRERLFIFVIIAIFLLFLQISFSNQSLSAFNTFIENQIGFNFAFSEDFFTGIVWFILFSISLRYFQINVLINRQYDYIHFLEDKICIKSGDKNFIRREGREYLKNYPILSDWAHIIYTWILPILLIVVTLVKMIIEISITEKYRLSLYFDGIIFIAIILTVIFYLINIHYKRQKNKK